MIIFQKAGESTGDRNDWASALRDLAQQKFSTDVQHGDAFAQLLVDLRKAATDARLDGRPLGEPSFVEFLDQLTSLRDDAAAGPDRIPAKILKRLSKVLARPFTILCRRLLYESVWPGIWRLHLICPLF